MLSKFLHQIATGQANKFLVAVLTAVAAALPAYFSSAKWQPLVVMAIGAVITYLVANTPADPPGGM